MTSHQARARDLASPEQPRSFAVSDAIRVSAWRTLGVALVNVLFPLLAPLDRLVTGAGPDKNSSTTVECEVLGVMYSVTIDANENGFGLFALAQDRGFGSWRLTARDGLLHLDGPGIPLSLHGFRRDTICALADLAVEPIGSAR